MAKFDLLWSKFGHFMQNLYSGPKTVWKNGPVCLSRPLNTVLAIRAKFGPLKAKISQIAGETPTFYWPPTLYLPIGIWNCPYFGWWQLFDFWLGSTFSQETCDLKGWISSQSYMKMKFPPQSNHQNGYLLNWTSKYDFLNNTSLKLHPQSRFFLKPT